LFIVSRQMNLRLHVRMKAAAGGMIPGNRQTGTILYTSSGLSVRFPPEWPLMSSVA